MGRISERIAIFGLISKHPGRNKGGVAMSVARLARSFSDEGYDVDILMRRPSKDHFLLESPPAKINFRFYSSKSKLALFFGLLIYVLRKSPHSILALDTRANLIASWLKLIPGLHIKVWASLRNALNQNNISDLRKIARRCDGIIPISNGLAKDFIEMTGVSEKKVHVISNPVVTPDLYQLAFQRADHPWLLNKECPVVMGIGRLTPQKDFATLVRAFAEVRKNRACRLIILGEGELRTELQKLAAESGIAEDVDFPGFKKNPWCCLGHADVFVLSSAYEGFGNVLAEAIALGVPAISTDCPSGPSEILEGGRLGPLIPVGDVHQLANAMGQVLDNPPNSQTLIESAQKYRYDVCGACYLEVMGLTIAPTNAEFN